MPFLPFEGPYCNHIGSCIHPVNSTIYMAVTFHPNGSGPFNLQIWEVPPPYTTPVLKRDWQQGSAEAPGPFGFCTLECLPSGAMWIGAPGGVVSANQIVPSTRVEPNMCTPFTPGGVPGPKGDTGPQGPAGAGGALAADDVEALRRLKVWLGI
jgi:hypothetical protein